MKLNQLPKLTARGKKRIGRGIGSGKGKMSGRGTKGQKARGKVATSFSGGGLPLYKKIPFLRGHGNKRSSQKPLGINLDKLNVFKANSTVDLDSLLKENLISTKDSKRGVKILNQGEIKQALIIKLSVSKKALAKIEKAGGKVG
ncbi:50S ribosomal protein L15 [Candidatus Daviesbacteria bacterium]|nr:50S ribosomal protein L15 [Candidatus Daviesbacteria bacterium]